MAKTIPKIRQDIRQADTAVATEKNGYFLLYKTRFLLSGWKQNIRIERTVNESISPRCQSRSENATALLLPELQLHVTLPKTPEPPQTNLTLSFSPPNIACTQTILPFSKSLCQCLSILMVKKLLLMSRLSLPWRSSVPFLHILMSVPREQRLVLSLAPKNLGYLTWFTDKLLLLCCTAASVYQTGSEELRA